MTSVNDQADDWIIVNSIQVRGLTSDEKKSDVDSSYSLLIHPHTRRTEIKQNQVP